jgi:hypothetical protein
MSEGQEDRRSAVVFELPDIVLWTLVGDVGLELMRELYDEHVQLAKDKRYVFSLVDVARLGSMSSEARTEAARKQEDLKAHGTAYIGASFHHRVLATLATKAANLLQRRNDNPMRFFATKAEALAWFAERRREIEREPKS